MTSRPNRLIPVLALFLTLICAAPLCVVDWAQAQPEGVSYTFTPTYNMLQWNGDIGLDDTELYGGRLGMSFGRMVSLQGFYLTRNDVRTTVGKLDPPLVAGELFDRKLDISNYGVDVTLNLGTGHAVPFLRGGGGILRFEPAQGDAIRQINMKAGGGMRFGFRHFQAQVFAEDSAFRIDRLQLAQPPEAGSYAADPDADKIRHNLSLGAGLTFFLGGTRESRLSETDRALLARYRQGLSGLSIPVEPFAGRLDFHDDLGLDNQYLVGLRTGFDFGRFFGLRGYYWRGVNDGFDKTVPIQSWGGEARFNLSSGQGAVPYLVTGVGQLDFMDDFDDEQNVAPDDKTMLILGGGLGFRLSDRFELDLAARDHLLSAKDLNDTSKPDDLLSNWMFGAAVRFSLGGSSPQGQKPLFGKAEPPSKPIPPMAEMESDDLDADDLDAEEMDAEEIEFVDTVSGDSVRVDVSMNKGGMPCPHAKDGKPCLHAKDGKPCPLAKKQIEKMILRVPGDGTAAGFAGDRMIMFPVPTEGEIYIRYGTPGGVSIESRSVTGEIVTPEGAAPSAPGVSMTMPAPPATPAVEAAPDMEAIREIIRDELRRAGVVKESGKDEPEIRWVEKEGSSDPQRVIIEGRGVDVAEDDGGGLKLVGFRAYTGLGMDDPSEFVLGGRVNLGPVSRNSPFLFVPEVALGLGSDLTTYLIAGNLQLPLGNLGGANQWSPYLSTGLGFLKADSGGESDTDLTINFALGVDAQFGKWAPFLEYQGVRGFDVNRLLVGVSFH